MSNRAEDFAQIRDALAPAIADQAEGAIVIHGDSLKALCQVPDESVSLILCDPPYHSTKKSNISGDRDFVEDEHFLEWMEQFAVQWRRILKKSGTLYVFCSSQMSARLEVMMSRYFRPISHITWSKPNEPGYDGWKGKMNKESLRAWYPHSERILMFEHGAYGTWEAHRRSPMGEYLLDARKKVGISMVTLCETIKAYGKINRGGAVANWEAGRNIPSREQYARLRAALESTGKIGSMLDYEDLIRPMRVSGEVEFTDVWNFTSVRPFDGKHPAEKPQDMLLHMIKASSYPGDIVLDCFAGSGSTGVAALRLGRRTVCIELEEKWVKRISADIAHVVIEGESVPPPRSRKRQKVVSALDSLFD